MFVHRRAAVNHSGVTGSSRKFVVPLPFSNALSGLAARSVLREAAVLLVVALAAVLVLRGPSVSQSFSVDESRWIATSRYFWITFVDRDLFGPAWQPNYLVYTHPPVARYVIGFGLWLQGWQPDQLNGRYDSLQSRAFNDRAGNVPSLDLLLAARRVTFVFAVASVVLVYVVGRVLGRAVGGARRRRRSRSSTRCSRPSGPAPSPSRSSRRSVCWRWRSRCGSCRRSAGSAPVAGCRWRSAPRWRWPPPPS